MVVKIMGSAASMKCPLKYNEDKVMDGEARVVGMSNMLDTEDPVHDTFEKYERANIRTVHLSFHMSINPGPGEAMDDGKVREFTGELMTRLGYKDQPFVIYQHDDIERRHYHVVSIRTGLDGRKVHDFLENRNCLRHLYSMAPKYGFTVGTMDGEEMDRQFYSPRFDPSKGIYAQMEAVTRDCSLYRFNSWDQFRLLMRVHGIDVRRATDGSGCLVLQGLDAQGEPCTRPVDERSLTVGVSEMCSDVITRQLTRFAPMQSMREVADMAMIMLPHSSSEEHFCRMTAIKGVDTIIRRDAPGRIIGVTFVDRIGRNVFNSSELRNFNLNEFKRYDATVWEKGEGLSASKVVDKVCAMVSALDSSNTPTHTPAEPLKDRHRTRRRR